MTKQQQRAENILQHGFKLRRTFGLSYGVNPVALCKQLHRIEARVHRQAEDECNGVSELSEAQSEARDKRTLDALDHILGFRAKGIPVFLNGDPRGYALKVEAEYCMTHPEIELPQDWGGYGIICPEF